MAKTTIKEVASLAGVSPSSVSRSLRGIGGVSSSTTQRVRQAAEQLGYSVSPAAYRLATGRTGTVAIVMPYLTRWFYAEFLGGAELTIREAGLDLLLYHVGGTEMRQRYFSSGLLRKRVDGVLLVTLALTEPEISALRALDVPVCVAGARVEGFSSVRIDDVESASLAVQHLVNLGHERVAIISGDPNEPVHFTVPLPRRVGYRATLAAAGIPLCEDLEAHGPFTIDGGDDATVQLLSRRVLPTAIFAECDEMAFGVLRALGRVGLRVPADVSVIGFDDHPMAPYFDLTTIAQDVREQGRMIAEHLVQAVASSSQGSAFVPVELDAPTRLVARGTTAVAGRDKPGWLATGASHSHADGWRLRQSALEEERVPV
ncbi:MAG TPA: LacI family DNA-binding transcriptional regulator [Acidimicrobiales bacterium]|nr:LacI family DNA-binding transcriptional regulator [Acidimicrobiales bacterium]